MCTDMDIPHRSMLAGDMPCIEMIEMSQVHALCKLEALALPSFSPDFRAALDSCLAEALLFCAYHSHKDIKKQLGMTTNVYVHITFII